MKYMAPVAELVSVEAVSVILASAPVTCDDDNSMGGGSDL